MVEKLNKNKAMERRYAGQQRIEERRMSNAKSGKRNGQKELWQVGQAVRNKSKTVGRREAQVDKRRAVADHCARPKKRS